MSACYLYNNIPGVWDGWTLAVYAASRQDAAEYMCSVHHGGKFVHEITGGDVHADCGACTEKASKEIRRKE